MESTRQGRKSGDRNIITAEKRKLLLTEDTLLPLWIRERCTEARRLLANDLDPSVLKKSLKKLKRDMSSRGITDPQDDRLLKLYIAAIKEALIKEDKKV